MTHRITLQFELDYPNRLTSDSLPTSDELIEIIKEQLGDWFRPDNGPYSWWVEGIKMVSPPRGHIGLKELRAKIKVITQMAETDPEVAHVREDKLMRELALVYMPERLLEDVKELVDTKFPRWTT